MTLVGLVAHRRNEGLVGDGRIILAGQESLRRGDQTKSWWLTTKIPLTDDQGRVIGLIGIARDITQRRREEAIRSGQSTLLEMIARNEKLQTILKTLVLLVESQIDLTPGTRLLSQSLSGDLISLETLLPDGGTELVIYDYRQSRIVGRVKLGGAQ